MGCHKYGWRYRGRHGETLLKFTVEKLLYIQQEIFPLWQRHWSDLALNRDSITLDPDWERYGAIDREGLLHLLTVRCESKLVGYWMAILFPHLHYKSAGLMAHTDAYYLLPEFRLANAGIKMVSAMEKSMRERGITKWYNSFKLHQDKQVFFRALGFEMTDMVCTKLLR